MEKIRLTGKDFKVFNMFGIPSYDRIYDILKWERIEDTNMTLLKNKIVILRNIIRGEDL